MAGIDETKKFLPVNIAVLTVSDTRTLETDTSGQLLADRMNADEAKQLVTLLERVIVND